jgi:multidrug resistance protein MdtO
MGSETIHIPRPESFGEWFIEFLKQELAPYPGRGALVARIIISATLSMILIETFRIPGGFIGALTAFLFSRESLVSTARSAIFMVVAFLIGTLFIPVGARLLASPPLTHFLWIGGSLFIAFFLLRCLTNYAIAIGFGLVISNVVGIWYLPGPAQQNVDLTLWFVLAALTGAIVTLCVEVIFNALRGRDDLVVEGLDARLSLIENAMANYADGQSVSGATRASLAQFGMVGAGSLRRHIARANYTQLYRARMSTLVSLVARSVDFAAAITGTYPSLPDVFRERAARLNRSIADIRHCLRTHGEPCEAVLEPQPSPGTPLFSEIESMVSLMPTIFSSENVPDPALGQLEDEPETSRIFVPDAFTNPVHMRFVLGGTLAAMLCYVIYTSLDWPGLATSVFTCVLTAATTIGASRQRQILRLAGFVLGGVIAGLGAQIFVLPYIDSIGGFTILFAAMTAVAAWIATASTRLAYAGVQFAFVFYLIQLSDFTYQTNLSFARDRVLGVLLGMTMMWLVFERLFPQSAADQMVRVFVLNVRLLADLSSSTARVEDPPSVLRVRRQRDAIYRNFGEVNSQSDTVPFETGSIRPGDMAARDRIRRWQASLRSFYLLEAPLLQFRVFAKTDSMSRPFAKFETDFRFECARVLLQIADDLQNQLATHTHHGGSAPSLVQHIDSSLSGIEAEFSERERALTRLTRTMAQIVDHLQVDVASQGLYDFAPASTGVSHPAEPEGA